MRAPAWLRSFGRWVGDPRTGLTLAGCLLAGAVIAFVVMSGLATRDAVRARDRSEADAKRTAAELHDRIDQLVDQGRDDALRTAALVQQVEVLQEQIRQMGGRPVVVVEPDDDSGGGGDRRAPPEPRPDPKPDPEPEPPPPDDPLLCVPVVGCIG